MTCPLLSLVYSRRAQTVCAWTLSGILNVGGVFGEGAFSAAHMVTSKGSDSCPIATLEMLATF